MTDACDANGAMTLREAIGDVYRQVQAPAWAARNLDGLADVLRDLSWLPGGPVLVRVPAVTGVDLARLLSVLADVETRSADVARPVRVIVG